MSRPKGSKNKAKDGRLNVAPPGWEAPPDDGRTTWISDISAFCMKRGFLVTQFIEKYEGLEAEVKELRRFKPIQPDMAPAPSKGLLGLLKGDPGENGLKNAPSAPLSKYMQERQAAKNGQKS